MNSDSVGVSGSNLEPASNHFNYSITHWVIRFIFVVFFVATFLTSLGANNPTAKEKLNQVNQAALGVAKELIGRESEIYKA